MKNADIGDVLKSGSSYRSEAFILRSIPYPKVEAIIKNTTKTITRSSSFGKVNNRPAFIAGKKIFKTAAIRNRVRRKMRAALQPFLKNINKKDMILFNLNKEVLTTPVFVLKKETEKVLVKSGMLKDYKQEK